MSIAVVVKTWRGDLCWTAYCLQFLGKNFQLEPGDELVLIANEDCKPVIDTWGKGVKTYYTKPWPDTYNYHMYVTMIIDDFTACDYVAIFDSDIMLIEKMSAKNLLEDAKPIIWTREAHKLNRSHADAVHEQIWFPITEWYLGKKPVLSYMQAFPFVYRTDLFKKVRNMVTERTKQGVAESLYSPVVFNTDNFLKHRFTFCDYEILGFYAHLREPERYVFRECPEWPPKHTKHYHSWSMWNDTTRSELDVMLAQ